MPPSRSAASSAGPTLSGFDSVVTSTSSATSNSSSITRRTDSSASGASSVGVPPPKKTVSTGRSHVAEHPTGQPHLCARGGGVRLPGRSRRRVRPAELGGGVGVEVAVAAARRAERHVHVEPEAALADVRQRRVGQATVGRGRVTVGEGGGHEPIVPHRPSGQGVAAEGKAAVAGGSIPSTSASQAVLPVAV